MNMFKKIRDENYLESIKDLMCRYKGHNIYKAIKNRNMPVTRNFRKANIIKGF